VAPAWDTALYYTLSTVAQSLAGAIGLLGAFALFALQNARQGAAEAAGWLSQHYPTGPSDRERFVQWYLAGDYGTMSEGYTRLAAGGASYSWEFHSRLKRLQEETARGDGIRRAFPTALLWTAFTIGGAVLSLPTTPWVAALPPLRYGILSVAVLATVRCLWLYGRLVQAILAT
jgi:hypothetical protein